MVNPPGNQQPQWSAHPGQPSQPAYGHVQYPVPSVHPIAQQSVSVPPRNGLGVAAMVLGIVAMVLAVFRMPVVFMAGGGFVPGTLALVFGIIGFDRASNGKATNKSSALVGIVTGSIGLAVTLFVFFLRFAYRV